MSPLSPMASVNRPSLQNQAKPIIPLHGTMLNNNRGWSATCLRPTPPLRPCLALNGTPQGSPQRATKLALHDEDAKILQIIEAYCTTTKPKSTVNTGESRCGSVANRCILLTLACLLFHGGGFVSSTKWTFCRSVMYICMRNTRSILGTRLIRTCSGRARWPARNSTRAGFGRTCTPRGRPRGAAGRSLLSSCGRRNTSNRAALVSQFACF